MYSKDASYGRSANVINFGIWSDRSYLYGNASGVRNDTHPKLLDDAVNVKQMFLCRVAAGVPGDSVGGRQREPVRRGKKRTKTNWADRCVGGAGMEVKV